MGERLPISGVEVELRVPTGADDVVLLDAPRLDLAFAAAFADRLARLPLPCGSLPVPDLDALFLHVHRRLEGDTIRATVACACGAPVDLDFAASSYLGHHRPRRVRGVQDEDGWLVLEDGVRCRPPTVDDLLAAAAAPDPEAALAEACLRPAELDRAVVRRVERVLDAVAPSLVTDVAGSCPECGEALSLRFDPQRYVLAELRDAALTVVDDVHALASRYGWAEDAILALPRARRRRYAELVRDEEPSRR